MYPVLSTLYSLLGAPRGHSSQEEHLWDWAPRPVLAQPPCGGNSFWPHGFVIFWSPPKAQDHRWRWQRRSIGESSFAFWLSSFFTMTDPPVNLSLQLPLTGEQDSQTPEAGSLHRFGEDTQPHSDSEVLIFIPAAHIGKWASVKNPFVFPPPAPFTVRQTSPLLRCSWSLGLKITAEIIEDGAFESLGHLKDLSQLGKILAPPLKHLPRSTIFSKVLLPLFMDCGESMAPALLQGAGTFCWLCRESSHSLVYHVKWPEHFHHLRGSMTMLLRCSPPGSHRKTPTLPFALRKIRILIMNTQPSQWNSLHSLSNSTANSLTVGFIKFFFFSTANILAVDCQWNQICSHKEFKEKKHLMLQPKQTSRYNNNL